jgi:hypothetical protein
VEFVRSGEQVAELPDGTIIVGIAPHQDRTRNLVAAAWAFARNAVLPLARHHLDGDVSSGLDFSVTKVILSRADTNAVSAFIREYWFPTIGDQPRLKELVNRLEILEDDALLGPVLLEEFAALGRKLALRNPSDDVKAETAQFVDHLAGLSSPQHAGEVGDGHFNGTQIRCAFILAGTADVIASKGAEPYRTAIDWAIRNAYPRIYVMARGAHIDLAREACKSFDSDTRVLNKRDYVGSAVNQRGPGNVDRIVIQLVVDVRQYVGIGQQPIIAVGSDYEAASASRRARRGRG